MYLIINEEPEFITKVRKDVPLQLEKILEKALAKNPEKRYQKMEEMLNDLNRVIREIKEGDSDTASIFKLGRKQRKQFYRSLVVVLILAAFGIYLWQSELAKAAPVSIALLPLQSLTNDAEQEWLTDSMTDALITDLAKISGLRVISRSSAMQYKGTEKTPPEIAAELGVLYVIEGSIVKMGDQVKISARLIDALNDEYLWAEEYDTGFSDILKLQGEIAQSIAGQIQVKLTPQEETRLAVSRSVDPKTYELYLKGMYHLNKYTPDGFEKGLSYLHQAVEKDPEEPLAHAGLAIGYNMLAHSPSPPPDALSKAKIATLKALELDANLSEAHFALGEIKIYSEWDREGAEQSLRRALELNPSLALCRAHLGLLIMIKGNFNEGYEELYRCQELDPLSPLYPAWTGWGYYWQGRYDEAIEEARKSLELVSDFPIGLYVLGSAYAGKGMFKEAIEAHQKAGQISPEWTWALGVTYALAGRKGEARQIAVKLGSQEGVWVTWGIAEIYAALGEKDEAFRWLEKAYEQHHPYIQWIRHTVSLKNLHGDPRFEDLAKRLNLPE